MLKKLQRGAIISGLGIGVTIILAIVGYLMSADATTRAEVGKTNDKVDKVIQDTNNKFLEIKGDLGEIKGALKIK